MKSIASTHKTWAVFGTLALALVLIGAPALAQKKGSKDGKATLVSVPYVLDKPRADAEAMLRRAGLSPAFKKSGTHVKIQDPPAKTRVAKGSKVTLFLYKLLPKAPLVSVPDVEGSLLADAKTMLRRAGLNSAFKKKGTHVKTQNPRAKTRVAKGSNVKLFLYTPLAKPTLVLVPDVQDKPLADAKNMLRRAGLNSAFKKSGTHVKNQDPPAKTRVARNSKVTLFLYTPKAKATLVSVPDVQDKPLADAKTMLRRAGLNSAFKKSGTHVKNQDPKAKTRVARGSNVKLFLYKPLAMAPKWVIASVHAVPRSYRPGRPLKLLVKLKDEAQSKRLNERVTLQIQWEYQDASGKGHRSSKSLELASKIRGADRYEEIIQFKEAENANGKDPIHLVLILRTRGKQTDRQSLVLKATMAMGTILVNNSPGPVVVNPGGMASVQWTMPVGSGVLLLVNNAPFGSNPAPYCVATGTPLAGVFLRNYVAGITDVTYGLELNNSPYTPGNSYFVMACAWDDSGFLDGYTNTVEIQYQDFSPVDLDLRNVKVHRNNKPGTYITFKIKNRSQATAPDYHVVVAHDIAAHGTISIPVSGHAGSPGLCCLGVGTITVGGPVRYFTVNTEDLPVGDHDVRVLIYWGPDTGNDSNSNWAGIQKDVSYRKVPSEGLPDLKIKNVQRSNNNGPNTSISFTVKNVGSAPAPVYLIGYRLGANHNPNSNTVSIISDEFSAWSADGLLVGQERQFPVPGQLPDGNHYLEIFVDSNNQIAEEKEDNNRKVTQYTKIPAGGLPDLTVTNLRRDHNNNDNVRIRFKVKNKGTAPVSGFRLRYYVGGVWSETEQSQVTLGPGQKSGDFAIGGSAAVQLPPGEYTLGITLDPDHEIAEENEGNNHASKHYNKSAGDADPADFKVKDVSRSHNNTGDVMVRFKVKNIGSSNSTNGYGIFYSIDDQAQSFHYETGDPLLAGEERAYEISYLLPVGDHRLKIHIAAIAYGDDSNTNNNTKYKNYKKNVSYDLKIKNVNRHRNRHSNVDITFDVKNKGPGESPSYCIEYSIEGRPDEDIDPDCGGEDLSSGDEDEHIIKNNLPGTSNNNWTLIIKVVPSSGAGNDTNTNNNTATKNYKKPGG